MIFNHTMTKWGKVVVSTTVSASEEGWKGKQKGSRNPSPGISSLEADEEFQKI